MYRTELRTEAEELIDRYPVGRSALLPLLHLVQSEDGYVSNEGIALCAELLGLTKAEVGAVATFYTMYKREELGEHLISVCTNFSCAVRGSQEVYDRLSAKLGVGHNGTTADKAFTLEHAECLGNCEGAPVVTVDYLNYECVDPDAASDLVDRIAAGDVPPPTRGFVPTGIREVSRRIAGLGATAADTPGKASRHARAHHGAPPVPDVGPGVVPVTIEPTFSPGRDREREAARAAVSDAGFDPDVVQSAAGPQAREFPTTDPDWEPSRAPAEPDPEAAAEAPDDDQAPGTGERRDG